MHAGAALGHHSGVSICTPRSWLIVSRFHGVGLSSPPTAPLGCSTRGAILLPIPSVWAPTCGCCSPWALQPSHQGSTRQSRDGGGWLGRFLLGGCDGCLLSPGEADKPFEVPPHALKSTGANTQNPSACKAQGGGSSGSGNVGALRADAPKEQPHGGVSGSLLLCCAGMGPLHAPLPGQRICCVARTLHRKHVLVPVAIRKYKETCFQRCIMPA